jgi:hypothetical protein
MIVDVRQGREITLLPDGGNFAGVHAEPLAAIARRVGAVSRLRGQLTHLQGFEWHGDLYCRSLREQEPRWNSTTSRDVRIKGTFAKQLFLESWRTNTVCDASYTYEPNWPCC